MTSKQSIGRREASHHVADMIGGSNLSLRMSYRLKGAIGRHSAQFLVRRLEGRRRWAEPLYRSLYYRNLGDDIEEKLIDLKSSAWP